MSICACVFFREKGPIAFIRSIYSFKKFKAGVEMGGRWGGLGVGLGWGGGKRQRTVLKQ